MRLIDRPIDRLLNLFRRNNNRRRNAELEHGAQVFCAPQGTPPPGDLEDLAAGEWKPLGHLGDDGLTTPGEARAVSELFDRASDDTAAGWEDYDDDSEDERPSFSDDEVNALGHDLAQVLLERIIDHGEWHDMEHITGLQNDISPADHYRRLARFVFTFVLGYTSERDGEHTSDDSCRACRAVYGDWARQGEPRNGESVLDVLLEDDDKS